MHLPVLETARLTIRPFTPKDLNAAHHLFINVGWANADESLEEQLALRRDYLEWSALNHLMLARLMQPPYGDRAVVWKGKGHGNGRQSNALIGTVGVVPAWGPFEQLPTFGGMAHGLNSPEMGLMWAVDPAYQQQGIATEAAQALIQFLFRELRLRRVVALTDYDNLPSQRVMQKLGMILERNPQKEPPWFQVVGILYNSVASS